jgi:hypothetical protein
VRASSLITRTRTLRCSPSFSPSPAAPTCPTSTRWGSPSLLRWSRTSQP